LGPSRRIKVDRLILGELESALELSGYAVGLRWMGTCAPAAGRLMLTGQPRGQCSHGHWADGTGASTGFPDRRGGDLWSFRLATVKGAAMQLKAVIFDWAGTVVDHGSLAPMGAFVKVFAEFGVSLSIEEARRPMGLPKRDHINALLTDPEIAARWKAKHGVEPVAADVDRIYEVFVPLNAKVVTDYAELIPGVLETVAALRARGFKIGSTTGYTRDIMERLLPVAASHGYAPENLVCAGDVAEGRPAPLMMYRCFLDLNVWPAAAVVKVDDTEPGIAEGLAAGSWTVAVAMSGNAVGLTRAELAALSAAERASRREEAVRALTRTGAHYVIDSVADLLPVIDTIDLRLARGERPGGAA